MRISDWSSDVCSSDLELAGWVRQGTGGRGVDVVFDGVGAASWQCSLAAVARRGLIISYGNASGPVPPVPPLDLTKAGSVFMTRPTLADYCRSEEHTSELQSLIRISYAVFCLNKKKKVR